MSNRELEFILKMRDAASAVWNKTKSTIQSSLSSLKSQFTSLSGVIQAAFAIKFVRDFIAASNEQEKASARLAQALRNIGESGAQRSMEEFSTSMQKSTVFADETVTKVQAMLVAMTGTTQRVPELTRAILDMASGLQMDAESVALLVAKTIQGQDALSRYGISTKGAKDETEKMNRIIDAAREKFGGFAENEAKTMAGRMEQVANAWNEVEETVGDFIKSLLAELLPAIQFVLPLIQKAFTVAVSAIKVSFATLFTIILLPFAQLERGLNKLGISSSTFLQNMVEAGKQHIAQYSGEVTDALGITQNNIDSQTQQTIKSIAAPTKAAAESLFAMKERLKELKTELEQLNPLTVEYVNKTREVLELQSQLNTIQRSSENIARDMGKTQDQSMGLYIRNMKLAKVAITDTRDQMHNLGQLTTTELEHMAIKQQFTTDLFYTMANAVTDGLGAAFSGVAGAGRKFLKTILLGFIDVVQGMLFAAAAAALVKGVLTFGTSVAGDLATVAAATVILQGARAIVASFHQGTPEGGVRIEGTPTQNVPIMVRGGETVEVRTEEQQRDRGGRGATFIFNFNSPVPHADWVVNSIKEKLRRTGLTIDQLIVNEKPGIILK